MIGDGMQEVVYCGQMGDWKIMKDEKRMEGVESMVKEGIKVIVGKGEVNKEQDVDNEEKEKKVGEKGIMVIKRVLYRGQEIEEKKEYLKEIIQEEKEMNEVI